MDDLERMLASMKQEPPVAGLEQRARAAFRRRRRRQVAVHAAASTLMIVAGLWLLLPAAGILPAPWDGLSVLQSLVRASSSGSGVVMAISSAQNAQAALSSSLQPANWLGLVVLGVGLLLGMNSLLPGRGSQI